MPAWLSAVVPTLDRLTSVPVATELMYTPEMANAAPALARPPTVRPGTPMARSRPRLVLK